jgi:hypothetical protein
LQTLIFLVVFLLAPKHGIIASKRRGRRPEPTEAAAR